MEKLKETGDFLTKDKDFLWHSMKPYNPDATMIAQTAEGSWVTDHHGNRYLDAMSGLWCVNVGYGRTELAEAAYEQLKEMAYFPLTQSHTPAIKLAEKLNELLEDEYVIFFSNSGSEANETAFKLVRQYHQQKGDHGRYKFISRYRAYHGNSMGSLAATGQAQRKFKYEPLAPGFIHVSPPDLYRDDDRADAKPAELKSVKEMDQVMTWELSETIAGVIMEPIITGGGVIVPPDGYMAGIKEVCEKHGALLIVDEVICGFGRTGKAFGYMNYGVKPDIITMAKGITSAYLPLSATAVKKDIYEAFSGSDEYDYFRHINTFGGNPAACALAIKNLEIMERESLFSRSYELGEQLKQSLTSALANHPLVGDIRGKGLLVGVELVKDKSSKEPLEVELVNKVIAGCKQRGVIIGKNGATVAGFNNVLTLAPPLNIKLEDLELIIDTLTEEIKSL
ncbi:MULTISPECIES: aspartate aminotransferase family protein [Heyndrickxia]|jgi:adenosylmethionine-8-amino-7-oxononanoate aminotransferase|uniref:aspartate aminotransferase family protein n=1 Tax=Heyndrickxia TaxID=2837504 RepID=UPI0015D2B94F|nr:aspartate aminotransferase family protein [Heyndrickxia oleronia]MCI1590642.1 aspartate aminotransferase family protein [Heyndrickxia oleronia]MCI1612169.1 aspartate aminotransferase family protein [Heyndrickxia oleronia]MCI1759879.1 aspartate aminotransferase family protein [Heyndrickxia oleronia]NYV64861.1 aspartate aminotransferase family protein [Bacillus sp. Gen3]